MFDAVTASILQSAPSLPGLDSSQIPQFLTRQYAQLVSQRLQGTEQVSGGSDEQWTLDRIADAYEIIASIEEAPELRRAAAFVAGTAQQIIARKRAVNTTTLSQLDRDSVDASVAASLLFLSAEQYADANEAAAGILPNSDVYEIRTLIDHIRDLGRGRLGAILIRAGEDRRREVLETTIDDRALHLLASALAEGIELLAADVLSVPVPDSSRRRFPTAQGAFRTVLALSSNVSDGSAHGLPGTFTTVYAGPAQLASLLLSAADALGQASLTKLPPPSGADPNFWRKWLQFRASGMPYVWPNHREAIRSDFYETGRSAVLVLPTGAGKTTVSALKIAGVLARGKNVVFLVPTHALAEQLTEDLQDLFPKAKFGLEVSSDFDSLVLEDAKLQDIEVMTPERCLAMLSYAAASFHNVGLLVFDECHLLSPESGKIGRALDGMLCLLAFGTVAPDADTLFLSAMLKNGPQFADWITDFTKRPCGAIELLWKPSRQARGVLVYEAAEVAAAIALARTRQRELDVKAGKLASGLRAAAKKELVAIPHVIWGLRHNWISTPNSYAITTIAETPVQLGAGYNKRQIWASPNANETASRVALNAIAAGLKTIVFVNTKADAVSTARRIAAQSNLSVSLTKAELEMWEALELELGGTKHSIFGDTSFGAVPHNASLLRLERTLSERLFKRPDGAMVIVATPTLAQGLNLPAHLAILAGDKRAGEKQGERQKLEAHELLNAAARAGRAGHLANGIVLLIPEPILTFQPHKALTEKLEEKLTSVLPEDDRCVSISDPLEVVLDRLMNQEFDDRDVRYTVNRLATLAASGGEAAALDTVMSRSFGAFVARERAEEQAYLDKVVDLWAQVSEAVEDSPQAVVVLLASQSGLPLDLLERLRSRLQNAEGELPTTIAGWVRYTIDWLGEDTESSEHLLHEVKGAAVRAAGHTAASEVDHEVLLALLPGVLDWIAGKPLREIEVALGGQPDADNETARMCPRARDLISTFIPRGLSFIMGVISRMVEELDLSATYEAIDKSVVRSLAAAVRKGLDSPAKLDFANAHREILGRVQIHRMYEVDDLDDIKF